jgi:hypothetical protein
MSEMRHISSAPSVRFDRALHDQTLLDFEQVNFQDEAPEHLTPGQVESLLDMTPEQLTRNLVYTYRITDSEAKCIVSEVYDINRQEI